MAQDEEYAICPYCGEHHGDCWEWIKGEEPVKTECSECGKPFLAWAEHTTIYHTKITKT